MGVVLKRTVVEKDTDLWSYVMVIAIGLASLPVCLSLLNYVGSPTTVLSRAMLTQAITLYLLLVLVGWNWASTFLTETDSLKQTFI